MNERRFRSGAAWFRRGLLEAGGDGLEAGGVLPLHALVDVGAGGFQVATVQGDVGQLGGTQGSPVLLVVGEVVHLVPDVEGVDPPLGLGVQLAQVGHVVAVVGGTGAGVVGRVHGGLPERAVIERDRVGHVGLGGVLLRLGEVRIGRHALRPHHRRSAGGRGGRGGGRLLCGGEAAQGERGQNENLLHISSHLRARMWPRPLPPRRTPAFYKGL